MSLLDRIRGLFGGGHETGAGTRGELGRHPDAQPVSPAQNDRGPTPEEEAAAATAEPQVASTEPATTDPGPGGAAG